MMSTGYHIPALLTECLEGLAIKHNGIYIDMTFGGGGHSRAILDQLGPEGKLIAFDQDPDAAKNTLNDKRFTLIQQNFRYAQKFLKLLKIQEVDGILADLGVSFHQFDTAERGFSLRFDGPLDMRMDSKSALTAADVLNTYDEQALAQVFFEYGELPQARRIAQLIGRVRSEKPLENTTELTELIRKISPPKKETQYIARVFQALRMEVNQEMDALKEMLLQCAPLLKAQGRLVVISYHSLEDRLVKVIMRSGNLEDKPEEDFFGNKDTPYKLITRKPIEPSATEMEQNPRSRSAKLRIAERKSLSESNFKKHER